MYNKQQFEKDLKKIKDKKGLTTLWEKLQKVGKTGHIINCSKSQKLSAKSKQEKVSKEIELFILDQTGIDKVDSKNDKDKQDSTEV
jgi:hypothetical protein